MTIICVVLIISSQFNFIRNNVFILIPFEMNDISIINDNNDNNCEYYSLKSNNNSIKNIISIENNINISDKAYYLDNKYNLSIIMSTRNDNYGGNLLKRLTRNLKQYLVFPWYMDYDLSIEIIIVEYNYIPTNIHIFQEKLFKELTSRLGLLYTNL